MNNTTRPNHLFQDQTYLRHDQYRNPDNLNARSQLHRRYSTNKQGWLRWVYSFLPLHGSSQVLDCGCGPAALWREHLAVIPDTCHIHLTDLSEGMVRKAQSSLSGRRQFRTFLVADIAALPYPSQSLDLVTANHMLYHVADRDLALREVSRVLKPGGRFVAATNGAEHLRELRQMGYEILPAEMAQTSWADEEFSLETGAEQLQKVFDQVTVHRYHNELLVTSVDDILAYLLSSSEARASARLEKVEALRRKLDLEIAADGFIHIAIDSGLFIAR